MISNFERLTVSSGLDPGGRVERIFAHKGRTTLKTGGGSTPGADRATIHWLGHSLNANKRRGRDTCHGVITLERR